MRQFTLFSLIFTVVLTCCSGCTVEFRDQQGRALDRPYGDEMVITTVAFVQNYNGWVAISVNGSPAITVPYGENFQVNMRSQKHFSYEVFWEEQIGYDGVLTKVRHSKTGLYSGKPIVIEEAFLRNSPTIEIIVSNTDGVWGNFSDGQGHSFRLGPGQSTILQILAGEYELDWRADNYDGQSMRGCKILRPGKKVFWNGRWYDDRIHVDRIKPSWQDLEWMQNGNCFPL